MDLEELGAYTVPQKLGVFGASVTRLETRPARAYHRMLKLGRTIADLAGEENIAASHLAEALLKAVRFGRDEYWHEYYSQVTDALEGLIEKEE